MNVRSFADNYRRKIEIFMEKIESNEYKPMGLSQEESEKLSEAEWKKMFNHWLEFEK